MKHFSAMMLVACLLLTRSWSHGDEISLSPGQKAPPLSLEKLLQAPVGSEANWEKLRGKVVVLEFWATWCGPCVDAIPHINELADQFKDKPVQFIALTEENQRTIDTFLAQKAIHTWVGLANHSTIQDYRIAAIPTTIVIRADGVIDGVTHPTALRAEHLQNLLAGKASGLAELPAQRGVRPGELPETDAHSALFQVILRPTTGGGTATFGGPAGVGPLGREIGKSLVGYTVHDMLPYVYESSQDRIIVKGNLPDGKYDLVAKIPKADEKHLGLRIEQALESTFGLTSRRETQEVDVYIATVAGANAKGLTPAANANSSRMVSNINNGTLSGTNTPVSRIIQALERGLSRPVVDETKLDGRFDVDLKWNPAEGPNGQVRAVLEQLGIALTPAKRRVEVVVIEPLSAPAAAPVTRPNGPR